MAETRNHIQFLLNDDVVHLTDIRPGETLLDYLRLRKNLPGTKEGCAEGDCGACTILVGTLRAGELEYESVNSCIRFMGSLDGCHVVTIEHLSGKDGKLHPVQQAMVDFHGSQCGFCTPGIVMSLYAMWMNSFGKSDAEIERSLQGNLCRCTGYEPIIKAARSVVENHSPEEDKLVELRNEVIEKLAQLKDGKRVQIASEDGEIFIPASAEDLAEIREQYPECTLVAGSTDVGLWVTKFMRPISPAVFIGNLDELQEMEVSDGILRIGAGVTYTKMWPVITKHIPQFSELWSRIGGEQVRNMGTIGGNVANGSPIGDTPPALIALGARIILRKGGNRRSVPLDDFFIEYGKQDREPGDFVEALEIPLPNPDTRLAAYKLSKRRDEDISSVCGVFSLSLSQGRVEEVRLAFGGMAGIPKRASGAETALVGQPWSEASIAAAQSAMEKDFIPLSDWRASAEYRMLSAKNLLKRFYLETSGETDGTRLPRMVENA